MKKIIFSVASLCLITLLCTACKGTSYLESKTEDESVVTEDEVEIPTTGFVQITGEVANPGVYEIEAGMRLFQVVEIAGGLTENAASDFINQAEEVKDGQNIHIASLEEYSESLENEEEKDDGKVNINTASKESLMTLPGIGEAKANLILDYRDSHGSFTSIEGLMEISGIKEGIFNKIKDSITV